jgi:hypothetical protein
LTSVWQADEQIEYITMCAVVEDPDASGDVFGYDRVHEVLSAHMWRDLVRIDKPRSVAAAPAAPIESDYDVVEDEVGDNDNDQDEVDADEPVAPREIETSDERELRKFEDALKAMASHQEKRKPAAPATVQSNGDEEVIVEVVGATESSDERKARLANAERMMAMFLDGVGLTMDDI